MRRVLSLLALVLLGAVLFAVPASAGEYPEDPGITVDNPNPDPGDTITITGSACAADVEVTIKLGGEVIGTTTTDADGSFTFKYEVPADTAPGTYEITAEGCGTEVLSEQITVGAAATTTVAGADLPKTGSSSTEPLATTGLVLVTAGALLVFGVRRRQKALAGR
jgi:LPXTG-motif cell wall-anchored protein